MEAEAEQERLQAQLRILHGEPRGIARAYQVANGFVVHGRHVHGGEIPGPQETRERDGIAAIGLHLVTRFARDERRRDHLTRDAFAREIAVEAVATGPGFIRDLQRRGFSLEATQQLIDVGLATADFSDEDRRRGIASGVGHRDRIFVDIQTNEQRSRLGHG